MKIDPHIIIVGAGPAGSIASILLARAGIRATLIEQHRFPRDKVCGECLSALGFDVLGRVGAVKSIERLRPIPLRRALLHAPNGSMIEFRLPTRMYGISRRALDHCLLEHARHSGVEIRQPARVERIDESHVVVRDLITNHVRGFDADCILVADGKNAPGNDLGIKAHFANVQGPRDAIELFGVTGHYGGLAPVEDGMWNASFSVPARRMREVGGEVDALFAMIVSENRTLQDRMRRAARTTDWHASALPRASVASRWPANQIPIGNAAASLEPIGGEGMGLAMRSAELAAGEIAAAHRERRAIDTSSLRAAYRRLWRVRSIACRAAAQVVSRPWVIDLLADAIDGRESLPQTVLRLVGKRPGDPLTSQR